MKILLDRPTIKLFYDAEERIVMGKMSGDIEFEDYKKMLLAGAKLARAGKIDKIILDRRFITRQDAECRTWVKNYYIKEHVKPLVPLIKKVAVIDAQSIVGKIYGKTILATLSFFYPSLSMKSFSELEIGLDWMIEKKVSPVVVDDVISDEKNFFEDIAILEAEHESTANIEELVTTEETPYSGGQDTSFLQKLFRYFFPD